MFDVAFVLFYTVVAGLIQTLAFLSICYYLTGGITVTSSYRLSDDAV